jgi:hypothetical protein
MKTLLFIFALFLSLSTAAYGQRRTSTTTVRQKYGNTTVSTRTSTSYDFLSPKLGSRTTTTISTTQRYGNTTINNRQSVTTDYGRIFNAPPAKGIGSGVDLISKYTRK